MNTFSVGLKKYTVGEIWNVPIEVDVTLLLALPAIGWWVQQRDVLRLGGTAVASLWPAPVDLAGVDAGWPLGTALALGFVASLLVHELGHVWVGKRVGVEPASITLWILGGSVRFDRRAYDPDAELGTLVAGPAASLSLGGFLAAALSVVPPHGLRVALCVGLLAVFNLTVGALNLLPTFPLDGAFSLRALLLRGYPRVLVNEVVGVVGRLVALGIVASTVVAPGAIVVALFGIYCYVATIAESGTAATETFLEGETISSFVGRPKEPFETTDPIEAVVRRVRDERPVAVAELAYPVVDEDDEVVGVVPARDLEKYRRAGQRRPTLVGEVMSDDFVVVPATEPAFDVLRRLRLGTDYVVVEDDGVTDVFTRPGFLRALELKERIAGCRRTTWP